MMRHLWLLAILSGNIGIAEAASARPALAVVTVDDTRFIHIPLSHSVARLSLHSVAYNSSTDAKGVEVLPAGWKIVGNPVAALRAAGLAVAPAAGPTITSHGVSGPLLRVSSSRPSSSEVTMSNALNTEAGDTGLWLPLGELTPVAAFRSGDQVTLVADGRHPLDTGVTPHDGPVRILAVTVLDSITVVTLATTGGSDPIVVPSAAGWSVNVAGSGSGVGDMVVDEHADNVAFTLPAGEIPSRIITLRDPASGRRLLVGLSRHGRIGTSALFRGAGFAVRPSIVGLVIAADSDAIELRSTKAAYVLDAVDGGRAGLLFRQGGFVSTDDKTGLVLSDLPLEELRESYRQAWTEAALAPPGRRFEARIHAARMAAVMGNGASLEGALKLALRDRPEGASHPDVTRLVQIAAAFRGRLPEGGAPDTDGDTQEDQFWRGQMRLLDRTLDDDQERLKTAQFLTAGLQKARKYAPLLRAQVVPQAATYIARNGSKDMLSALDGCEQIREERLACALRESRRGAANADMLLDGLAGDTNPVISEGAREERTRREETSGQKTAAQTAETLDALIPAARFIGREREIRRAEIRAALAADKLPRVQILLDEWTHLFPDRSGDVASVTQELARKIEGAPDTKAAFDRLSFLQKKLGLASDPRERITFMSAISSQYEALGLFQKARDALAPAISSSTHDDQMALRLRMARLDFRNGDESAVLQDLQDVTSGNETTSGISSEGAAALRQKADLLRAQVFLSQGKYGLARTTLSGVHDRKATLLMVDVEEGQKDWAQAARVLQGLIDIPTGVPESDETHRQYIMRMAEDASRSGDELLKQRVRMRYGSQMAQGPQGKVFELLTGAQALAGGDVAGG